MKSMVLKWGKIMVLMVLNWGKQTFIFHAAKDWNSLPNDLKECNILSIFKSKLKTFLKDLS